MAKPSYLKKLYKKTATGAIQEWLIGTQGTTIVTTYGQVGGKMQTTTDSVKSGKNLGRKNATDQETQTIAEAGALWLKKKKAGYVESLKDAESGKTDSVIEGGVIPMLAKVFEDHEKKVTYPIAVQPKLDGHRCIAHIDDEGDVTLWTRTRKRITSVPHIAAKLSYIAEKTKMRNVYLDGEIYNHDLKDDFEKLTSAARKKETSVEAVRLQYHVYDIVMDECFKTRLGHIGNIILFGGSVVHLVETVFVDSPEMLSWHMGNFLGKGYEGTMVRLLGRGYENKRSDQLLKVKRFSDGEFMIVGAKEGRGKLQGHCGAFICALIGGGTFDVKMSGDTDKLKEYWVNREEYIGSMITVQYQGFTSANKPRFPVGLRIRDDL